MDSSTLDLPGRFDRNDEQLQAIEYPESWNMSDQDKEALEKATQGLPLQQLQHLLHIFKQHDTHGGGVDVHQLAAAMNDLGTDLTLREAEKLIQAMDTSGDGFIQFWEFVEFFKPKVDHPEQVELGGIHQDAGGDAAQNNQAEKNLEAQFAGFNQVAMLQDQITSTEKKLFKIEDKIAAQRKILSSGVSSQKLFRLLGERKREWLVCRDKIDTMKAEVEKLKRKYAKKVPQTNDKKIVLYKSIDSDLDLGLKMADEVQSRMRLCQKLMRDLRFLKVQEQAMLLDLEPTSDKDTAAALKQLQREMADIMAELRTRAGELESQYEQVANGANTVQWYWNKEIQTDLFFARNDVELEIRRERDGFLRANFAIRQPNVSQTRK